MSKFHILLLAYCALPLTSCGAPTPPQATTPTAMVSHPLTENVIEWSEYPGRLESPQDATVSARVSGIIERAPFEEGALVNKGDILFLIDERPFRAELASKIADLKKASAQQSQAEARFKRFESLQGTKAISAEDFDEAQAALQQARALVGVAEAQRDIAALNMEWTKVLAPISGRVGRKLVTEGNLVNGGAGVATALTTITSVDPLHCYISLPEREFLRYKSLSATLATEARQHLPSFLKLENETSFTRSGYIDFVDNRIEVSTGTVAVRGVFSNTDGALAPGLFARMRMPMSREYSAVLVPESAIGTDQNSRFVLALGKDDTLAYRAVTLGALFGSLRAISQGLNTEDRILLTGLQQLRPGTKVSPQNAPISSEPLREYRSPIGSAPIAPGSNPPSKGAAQ